jgi:hypothetical protein
MARRPPRNPAGLLPPRARHWIILLARAIRGAFLQAQHGYESLMRLALGLTPGEWALCRDRACASSVMTPVPNPGRWWSGGVVGSGWRDRIAGGVTARVQPCPPCGLYVVEQSPGVLGGEERTLSPPAGCPRGLLRASRSRESAWARSAGSQPANKPTKITEVRAKVCAKVCARSPVRPIFSVTDRSAGELAYLINDTSTRPHLASRQATALRPTPGEEDDDS